MKIAANYTQAPNTKNVSFGASPSSVISKVGKSLEFNGFNFSTAGLGIVTYGAVLAPRYFKARDKYERREILFRDFTTITTILFARRAIQNIAARIYAKKTGLVLSLKPANHEGLVQKVFNYLRPDKGIQILSSAQLEEKYTNLHNCKNGLADFAQFLKEQGGDVKKVLTSDKTLKQNLETAYNSWKPSSSKKTNFASADAQEITNMLKDLSGKKNKGIQGIENFFKDTKNSVVTRAKSVNANLDFLIMLGIVPAVLGVGLPCINERLTKNSLGAASQKKSADKESKKA